MLCMWADDIPNGIPLGGASGGNMFGMPPTAVVRALPPAARPFDNPLAVILVVAMVVEMSGLISGGILLKVPSADGDGTLVVFVEIMPEETSVTCPSINVSAAVKKSN